jgi:hypothetical protein
MILVVLHRDLLYFLYFFSVLFLSILVHFLLCVSPLPCIHANCESVWMDLYHRCSANASIAKNETCGESTRNRKRKIKQEQDVKKIAHSQKQKRRSHVM